MDKQCDRAPVKMALIQNGWVIALKLMDAESYSTAVDLPQIKCRSWGFRGKYSTF